MDVVARYLEKNKMGYEKYYNEEDKKDIEMFLNNVEELYKPNLGGNDISAREIMNYVVNLLKPFNSDLIDPSLYEIVKNHVLEDPDQMLRLTGEVAAKIACNALNEVDSHNTTLSVLRILQQFPWETKAILTIASFILTYGDNNNGLNLCGDSKIAVENVVHHFIRGLLRISYYFGYFEMVSISFMTSEDLVDAMRQLMIVVYSITRVVVVVASSKLMTRSSIGDIEDKYGTSGSTWCSADLDFIEEQLHTIIDIGVIYYKVTDDREEEDEEEVRYSYLVRREATVETFDVNVVGDTLLINFNYVDNQWERKIELGKEYRKEEIRAVLNKNDGRLHITLPKFKKPADPQSLHIPVTLSTSS